MKSNILRTAPLLVLLVFAHFSQAQSITTTPLVSDFDLPMAIEDAKDGSGRLFFAQQRGRIMVFKDNALLPTPFLDIEPLVGCCSERGLLGFAFHPDYASNGYFFINYTDTNFDTVVARYRVSINPDVADPGSAETIIAIEQPGFTHNGGHLAFGPDGYLYIGMGDGGTGSGPGNPAQDPQSLLGKMLRLDVDNGLPYTIPPDNPFAADDFTLDEIWASGLRNPWRYSFDRLTGDLFIGDVGETAVEEVDFHAANTPAGADYGWTIMEGSQCLDSPQGNCNDGSLTLPIIEYDHSGRCSVTGGYRYRGNSISTLIGKYLFADYCSGEIFAAEFVPGIGWEWEPILDTPYLINTFGEDEHGELYFMHYTTGIPGGSIHAIVPQLSISPASGNYSSSQTIDLSLALRKPNVSVNSISATLNGGDVSADFNSCIISGTVNSGGLSFRCPAIGLNILDPGIYTFSVQLQLSDGTSATDSVTWNILETIEQ